MSDDRSLKTKVVSGALLKPTENRPGRTLPSEPDIIIDPVRSWVKRAIIKDANMNRVKLYNEYIASPLWQKQRQEKLNLNPTCEICAGTANLHVHHLKYREYVNVEMRHLMTLCEYHHMFVHELLRSRLLRRHHTASTMRRLILKRARADK